METATLLDRLNLEHPGLEKVEAVRTDPARAATALLAYFRARTSVQHPTARTRAGGNAAGTLPAETRAIADDAVRNILIAAPVYPRHDFGPMIDWFTNRGPQQDHEWIVQLHRHYSWDALAAAWARTGEPRYAETYTRQLADWIAHCPPTQRQPAWGDLEVGIRSHAWTGHFQAFVDAPAYTPELLVRFLSRCHDHAAHLAGRPFNKVNWGLMEAEGLAFLGFTFPEFKEAAAWRASAIAHLNAEILRQVRPDGHQVEQCLNYHAGCIRWFQRTAELARMNGQAAAFPEAYWKRLEAMVAVLPPLSFPDGSSAQFGDTHDPVDCREGLATAAAVFARPDFRHVATGGREGAPPERTAFAFKESGFYALRSGWDEAAMVLVLKCGPDGGWHCQPDNGTFELFAFGRRLMPDSGTYIYVGDAQANRDRAWFRQTRVHQTLTLDGRDTAYAPALRLWQPGDNLDTVVVENAGYPGFVHRRTVLFVRRRFFVLVDEALGAAAGNAWLHFQFAPGEVVTDKAGWRVHTVFPEGGNLLLQALPQEGLKLTPEEGQVSFRYGTKEPRPALRLELPKDAAPDRFVTLLVPYPGTTPPASAVSLVRPAPAGADQLDIEVMVAGERFSVGYDLLPQR